MDSKILKLIIDEICSEPNFYEETEPLKYKKLERMTLEAYEDVRKKVEMSETICIEKLVEAIATLENLSMALRNRGFEIGIAVGLKLHNDLTELLNKPINALKKMFDVGYPTLKTMHARDFGNISEFTEEKYIL